MASKHPSSWEVGVANECPSSSLQIDVCESNADTYEKLGNIGSAAQYKNMAQSCQKELLAIKGIESRGLGPPKFTMETRKFTVVRSHAHLSSGQCEVEVVRLLNLPRPAGYDTKDLCIYVELEFPWPADSPQKECTSSVRDSTEPEFNSKHTFEIDRKHSRSMLRIFKRSPVKCGVWQRRTLRKDLFIGGCGLVALSQGRLRSETPLLHPSPSPSPPPPLPLPSPPPSPSQARAC